MNRGQFGQFGHFGHLYDTVLVPKDVAVLLDYSARSARRRVQEVRMHLNKPNSYRITLREFCEVHELNLETYASKLSNIRLG